MARGKVGAGEDAEEEEVEEEEEEEDEEGEGRRSRHFSVFRGCGGIKPAAPESAYPRKKNSGYTRALVGGESSSSSPPPPPSSSSSSSSSSSVDVTCRCAGAW